MTGYNAPQVAAGEATPTLVRDELLRCFESANQEFMAVLDQPTSEAAIRSQVRSFVTGVFEGCGASSTTQPRQG